MYYKVDDSDFLSNTRRKCIFIDISKNVGYAMTFKILADDTKRVIYRSNTKPVNDPMKYNL